MKSLILGVIIVLTFASCSHKANKNIFIQEVKNNHSFIQSDFESLDPCEFALVHGESRFARFNMATCGLTTKQLIVYSSDLSGNLRRNLIYLNYSDIEGVALARFYKGAQIQLKTNKGLVILQPGGGSFVNLNAQKKYLKIFKKYGIKELTPNKYILMQQELLVYP